MDTRSLHKSTDSRSYFISLFNIDWLEAILVQGNVRIIITRLVNSQLFKMNGSESHSIL